MEKQIIVSHGDRKELMKIFQTTYPTISSALKYKCNSDISNRIRRAAINRGGVLVSSY